MRKYIGYSVVLLLVIGAGIVSFTLYKAAPSRVTPEPVPVVPIPTARPIASVTYSCNQEHTIDAAYFGGEAVPAANPSEPPQPSGWVDITLDQGKTIHLNQTISADGGRYANGDETFVFWNKGKGALVLENDKEGTYAGCIENASPQGAATELYHNGTIGFTLRYPKAFSVNDAYVYQARGPEKDIHGVAFTLPSEMATGTNLSGDTYLSVESIQNSTSSTSTNDCSPRAFLADQKASVTSVIDGGVTYAVASTTGAAAGNRYEETVYTFSTMDTCVGVRYFIHYGVFENYPDGAVTEFDRAAVLSLFDTIRRTIVVR